MCLSDTSCLPCWNVGWKRHKVLWGRWGLGTPSPRHLHTASFGLFFAALSLSVFSDERRDKKGGGSEGSQGGSGERAEAVQKRKLNVLIGKRTSECEALTLVGPAALPKAQGSGSAVWRKPWGSLQDSQASCLCFSHGFQLGLSRDKGGRPHLLL